MFAAAIVLSCTQLALMIALGVFDSVSPKPLSNSLAVLERQRNSWNDDKLKASFSWVALLGNRLFARILKGQKRKRRFWVAARSRGVWEREFLCSFSTMARRGFSDWEDNQYLLHLRFGKDAFWRLHALYGHGLERKHTNMRSPLPSEKRLAITLHWLAHGLSFQQLALMYGIGKSTAVNVVHSTIEHLLEKLVPGAIKFPTGRDLHQVMKGFECLAGLPYCAGAVNGTFMKIDKPTLFGDSYWCYKKYPAILILGTVDSNGLFMNVYAGSPGSAGDAATFHRSTLKRRVEGRKWLDAPPKEIHGVQVLPYLVGDSAFSLTTYLTKCYSSEPLTTEQCTFNYRVIRTRRCSTGRV